MSTHAEDLHATEARSQLMARRAVIARIQRNNETDGAQLRQDNDSRERSTGEAIADVLVSLSDREREEVAAIDAALTRLDLGTWGRCSVCSSKIAGSRLSAMPETHKCLACAADPLRS